MKKNTLDLVAKILLIVGGINWGLVGLLDFDLVAWLAGLTAPIVGTILYVLVGLSALYVAYKEYA